MAGDAALLLRDLLASGVEVPYEVRESGAGSPLAEYVPQTSAFIRDNASQLAALDSYGTTCAALESDGLATSYLEEMGVPVPADSRRRAELAGVVFLCRLWQGSTDFTLDDVRLAETIEELLDCGEVSLRRGRDRGAAARVPDGGRKARARRRHDRPLGHRRRAYRSSRPGRHGRSRVGALVPRRRPHRRDRRRGRRERHRHPRGCSLQAGRHHPSPVQGGRRRAGPARLGQGRRRPLAARLDGRGPAPPGRLPPGGHRARRPCGALERGSRTSPRPSTA